jgi:hypothetical protein
LEVKAVYPVSAISASEIQALIWVRAVNRLDSHE